MNRLAATLTLALSAATAAPALAEPDPTLDHTRTAASARIEVDLSERMLYLYNEGSLMNSFSVAVGTDEHPTPTGNFTINRIIWNPDWIPPDVEWAEDEERKAPSDPDNPMEGAKIFFEYPDYYIHGTDANSSLGTEASHGCIRMNEVDVENLAEFLQKVGGESRSEAWFDNIRDSETNMTEIYLDNPIEMEVRE